VALLNYGGTFDAALFSNGLGRQAHGYVHLDAPPAHAPHDAIVVPDAHFLFNADFARSGADLILSGDGREVVLHDYFRGEKRAPLASPDGAHLTADLVNTLTGSVQVSQADGTALAGKVIGHVTKLQGTATAIRNGVSILLHQGDNVEKGDVVQSGSNSTLGISFIDGTVFGMSSNARMVLNEMVYDPNGSNNSSLISLVAGTISFVAGETAKHGDMKIDTPVATMGIRGTAVLVEIDFTVPGQGGTPDAKFQVLVEPDGTTGSYVLFDKTTLQPIAVVNQAGQQINISNGLVTQTTESLSPDIQKLITDVFSLKFTDNTNPKSTTHFTDIGVLESLAPIKVADGTTATPTFLITNPTNGSPSSTPNFQGDPLQHFAGRPDVAVLDASGHPSTHFALTELVGKTGDVADADTISGKVNFADLNPGDLPTASVTFKSFAYVNAGHADVSGSLSALQLQDIAATEVKISVVADPGNRNHGSAAWTYSVPDHAFDFLAAGETLTLTYIVRVDNNFAPSNEYTEIPITITVTGTNDAPVITTGAQTIAFSGGTSVSGGSLPSDDPHTGTLTFSDVDLTDTHTVSAKLITPEGDIPPAPYALFEKALTATLATDSTGSGTGAVNWKLADLPVYVADFIPAGQTLTLTYLVMVTDSQGASSEQTVTVTITGTDKPAEVWIATTGGESAQSGQDSPAPVLLWNDGANWETGLAPTANDDVIIITDQLLGLTPAFPVTIDAAAFAKSVTMNDYGGGAPPELDNQSTLTVGGAFTVNADARVYNFHDATIGVGGKAEFLDHSMLVNSGTLLLAGGGDFGATAGITNTGTIELTSGILNVFGTVANVDDGGCGLIQVDADAALVLDGGGIKGGSITVAGTLALDGAAFLAHGWLDNSGTITVSGHGNSFDGETVTSDGTLEILTGGKLTLDQGTSFDNCGGSITVDDGAKLTLHHAAIAGGDLTNDGTLALTGTAALIGGTLGNSGAITVRGRGNLLAGETVTNEEGASITIAFSGMLALSDTGIIDGELHNHGQIDVIANSVIDGSAVDGGGAIVIGGFQSPHGDGGSDNGEQTLGDGVAAAAPVTLRLAGGAAISRESLTIGRHGELDVSGVNGASLSRVDIDSHGSIKVDAHSLLVLEHSSITGGHLINSGTVHVETALATTFDNVDIDNGRSGVIVVDDAGQAPVPSTLILDGHTSITGGSLSIGIAGTLDVAGSDVTLSGVHVQNSGAFSVDPSALLELAGTDVTGSGTFSISGTVAATGSSSIGGTVINNGTIEIVAGKFEMTGSLSGTGAVVIDAGATLQLDGSDTQTVKFNGDHAELVLDAASFGGSIKGLGSTDKLDLAGIEYGTGTTAIYNAQTGVLTVSDGDGHTVSLALSGADYSNAHFAGSSDGHGGTLITLNATDDAPAVAANDAHQSAVVAELENTTGSSTLDAAGGTIHFSDADLTDRPTASISAQSVTWTAADQSDLSASLTADEVSALEHALTLTQTGSTNNGTVDWTYAIADHALDFLGAGQTVTVTSTVAIDDHHGGVVDVPVTVTITGSEDAPVITGETNPSVQTVILAKSPIVLAAGQTMNSADLPTETFDHVSTGSGFSDGHSHHGFYSEALHATFTASGDAGVVHGSSPVSAPPYVADGVQDSTNYLSVGGHAQETISFDHQENSFGLYWGSIDSYNSIEFYDGNKLVASYTGSDVSSLQASGGQHSFSSNGYVEFLDLAPFNKVVLASGQNSFELDNVSAGTISDSHVKLADPVTGTLTVSDKDVGDTLTASVIGDAIIKYNGSSHLPANVDVEALTDAGAVTFDSVTSDGKVDTLHWSYNPDNADLDFLEPGDTLTITYQAEVSDGHGSFGMQPLTVTIKGNGSQIVSGTAQNDTFDDVGGGGTIFGRGGNDTFVFNPHFGSATIADFNVSKDAIEIDHSLFRNVQDILAAAQPSNHGSDTVITDTAHDTITLKGVTIAQLTAHQNDFHFV
jgi:VCBS repeat-containing protein